MKSKVFFVAMFVASMGVSTSLVEAAEPDYTRILKRIARDIEKLKPRYPQLKEFSVNKNLDLARLTISYAYHTHEPKRIGGWTSAVPNPNEDGVWFYIDIHDPNSIAQIHTQPVTVPICLGSKKVSYLILEGTGTKSVGGAIQRILTSRGAKQCGR